MPTFEELLERWDGEQVVIRHDSQSGAWIFICLHSTRLGPAGRCRIVAGSANNQRGRCSSRSHRRHADRDLRRANAESISTAAAADAVAAARIASA